MPRHVAADLGEVGFTGAGLMDEFAVEHHDQTVRKFEQFVKGTCIDRRDAGIEAASLDRHGQDRRGSRRTPVIIAWR